MLRASVVSAATLRRNAVENARHALEDVRRAIAERAELQRVDGHGVGKLCDTESIDLLERQSVGRFVYIARAGVPDVVPVNYVWSGGRVLIRSGPGPKLQAAQRGDVVAFEVDELDAGNQSGCSVVVVGRASVVPPSDDGPSPQPWAEGPRRHLIRIVPDRMEGRRLG